MIKNNFAITTYTIIFRRFKCAPRAYWMAAEYCWVFKNAIPTECGQQVPLSVFPGHMRLVLYVHCEVLECNTIDFRWVAKVDIFRLDFFSAVSQQTPLLLVRSHHESSHKSNFTCVFLYLKWKTFDRKHTAETLRYVSIFPNGLSSVQVDNKDPGYEV